MEASLARDFKYAIERESQILLENPAVQPHYKREVRRFSVKSHATRSDKMSSASVAELHAN